MKKIAIVGASGFIGQNLIKHLLDKTDFEILAIAPNVAKIKIENARLQKVSGDVFDYDGMLEKLKGIQTVFYLVHMMCEKCNCFSEKEDLAAKTFGSVCKKLNVERVIYLSGLGSDSDTLSEHLSSRHKTGKILREFVKVIEFRASMVISSGSISFDIVKSLISKLPIVILPKCSKTLTQPIGLNDVLTYLISAIDLQTDESQIVEIGGPEKMSYQNFLKLYAKWLHKKVLVLRIPILPEWIAGSWLYLVTSRENARVGSRMVPSFKNEMIVTNNKAKILFPNILPKRIEESF